MAIPIAARRKVMNAAGEVATNSPREAAILGGVVRSVIEHGHMKPEVVRWWTTAVLGHFNLAMVDRRPPCAAEMAMVIQRFEEVFGRRVA
jgi:hypothetical protein